MILPFSTQMNGKPTYFVERIWEGLLTNNLLHAGASLEATDRRYYEMFGKTPFNYDLKVKPKLHTIREDKSDRWKVGTKIDFFINCRQKDMFRFAPVLKVVSVQKVEIMWFECFGKKIVRVFIDDKSFACVNFEKEMIITGNMLELAQKDGFDTIEDFFAFFDKDYIGKIIHWTDLRY